MDFGFLPDLRTCDLEGPLEPGQCRPDGYRGVGAKAGDELAGKTFVFTGSLSGYTRSEAQQLVEDHGGNATGSVSGNTDYLVAGSSPGRTKLDDAESEDVPVLDGVDAFEEKLEEYGV